MTTSLEAIRAKLLEKANKKEGGEGRQNTGDNAAFQFWNIPFDTSALVRFLPDGNPENIFFWEKREVIKLPFAGVVGGDYPTSNNVTVEVPCVEMFGKACPITAAIRPWWKDEDKKELARVYYKKKSYIFQGFVVQSPFQEQNVPENPIRRFVLNPGIYDIVEQSLTNPEMEDAPTDYVNGRDFKITKTKKGEYANYSTSNWSFKTRSLTEAEHAAIEQYGLRNLKDFLGRVPDSTEIDAIKAMFDDSLAGNPFDYDSFGKYYRPYGNRNAASNNEAVSAVARTPVRETVAPTLSEIHEPVAEEIHEKVATNEGKASTQDILQRIRDRSAAR